MHVSNLVWFCLGRPVDSCELKNVMLKLAQFERTMMSCRSAFPMILQFRKRFLSLKPWRTYASEAAETPTRKVFRSLIPMNLVGWSFPDHIGRSSARSVAFICVPCCCAIARPIHQAAVAGQKIATFPGGARTATREELRGSGHIRRQAPARDTVL